MVARLNVNPRFTLHLRFQRFNPLWLNFASPASNCAALA